MANDDVNVVALIKGNERYIFIYEDATRDLCTNYFGRFAGNTELSFTWLDAAMLSMKVRGAESGKKI